MSHPFVALTCEILFLPLEHKIHIFSPSFNILYFLRVSTKFHDSGKFRKMRPSGIGRNVLKTLDFLSRKTLEKIP